MKTLKSTVFALLFAANASQAALQVGDQAPDFKAEASMAGEAFEFNMQESLKKGPVIVYFYPKAFTPGCTIEAHKFAEAADEFAEYGASIIGVSSDEIDTLHEFSVSECRNKFAVAADPEGVVIQAYDASFGWLKKLAARISYVIAPGGKILHVLEDNQPEGHIIQSLAAVKAWSTAN